MKTAIILISKNASTLAQNIKRELRDAEVFSTTDADNCQHIDSYAEFLREKFLAVESFVFIGAMGICVRLIAPFVSDKYTDPAVVCVDGMGRFVIPVLSGHVGGANELAQRVAHIVGGEAVITTQSDAAGLWSLDLFGKKYNWEIETNDHDTDDRHKAFNKTIALFVRRLPTLLVLLIHDDATDELERTAPDFVTISHKEPTCEEADNYKLLILVSPFIHKKYNVPTLQFVPKTWHVGIGLSHLAQPADSIVDAITSSLTSASLNPLAIKTFSTIEIKKEEPVVQRLQQRGYVFSFFTAEELREVDVPNGSAVVEKHVATPSVSEAAARLSANLGDLILTKQKGENYTVAVAAERGILHKKGHIEIVGAGPGDTKLITLRGREFLERADLILYAGSLVPQELTFCAKEGATVRSSASMTLEEQFALMKKFYDKGALIVRLHTGDPCIYGAIEEQMNFFDQHEMSYHITPGVSSFQAAAAELKSQFTIPERVQTIILTRGEGRTPMPEREKLSRLAQSQSTMCIFLSGGIAKQVQDELLQAYKPTTPVAVCYHLTWRDQKIVRGELQNLASIVERNNLKLTTMIVVGEAIDNREGVSRLYAEEFKHLYRKK